LTVSAYERTVQKGLLVPYAGLLNPRGPPGENGSGGGGGRDGSTGFLLFAAIASELPRLDEPQVAALEWGGHLRGVAKSLAWCDAFRVQELTLAARMSGKNLPGSAAASGGAGGSAGVVQPLDDCELLHLEPACMALGHTLALRCRAVAGLGSAWPPEATQTYAEARVRLTEAVSAEAPLRSELESLKAIVEFHEATNDDEDSLLAARLQV
jgi:hypothetical protein